MYRRSHMFLAFLCFALTLSSYVKADEKNHKYEPNEQVKFWVNKVGPYNNPQETYNYYSLPYCKPLPNQKAEHSWGGLGEVLQGNELINSQLDIKFKKDVSSMAICTTRLNEHRREVFNSAIHRHYWYEFFVDDLPVWGFVGELKKDENGEEQAYVFTHRHFDISFNNNRIIHVNQTSDNPVLLSNASTLYFTVSVKWHSSNTPFSKRFDRFLDNSFFEHRVHWFSILNSFLMVIFLLGIVSIILMRTLRKDIQRYALSASNDLETQNPHRTLGSGGIGVVGVGSSIDDDDIEETGWKLVHGDVFRPPRRLTLLAACLGTGVQLSILTVAVIVLSIAGDYFTERGTILTVFILFYTFTSVIGGFVSGGFYARHDGRRW
eukprot:CAMPEP_0175051062 /NCGR_PEP_ID=MMETSP0052_2-20121109/7589_1 /TAXON_ID=51329 ORGANISM="Polytomella parva, Strain SAG 63-3" /NCGR_SAMPLE_ID=MMETSP0052_2 /ASSEMBLY_ACC=CAM_ASM_000194 /LENGTH=377 /DNA_ID=CAMNT_0016315301 /DNA_START=82 /DNA_END=1212 /DNA_ORIENTATION=+